MGKGVGVAEIRTGGKMQLQGRMRIALLHAHNVEDNKERNNAFKIGRVANT